MLRAEIENSWHKNLVDRVDGLNFFRLVNAKFADAKLINNIPKGSIIHPNFLPNYRIKFE